MCATVEIMTDLFRFELFGKPLPQDFEKRLTDPCARRLYALTASHDLAHLAADALETANLLEKLEPQTAALFTQSKYKAICRHEQQKYEYERVASALSQACLPYMPLKGLVLKKYWKEPWLRTSHDLDIMVPYDCIKSAVRCVTDKLAYKKRGTTNHDISLLSPAGVILELHHSMLDNMRSTEAARVIKTVWDHALPSDTPYEYTLDEPMFVFLHIAHMADHFERGGCGIRFFIDLWLMNKSSPFSEDTWETLRSGKLEEFTKASLKLAGHWFEGIPGDKDTAAFEKYILSGGLYGSLENKVAFGVCGSDGSDKRRYIMSRIFMPYERMEHMYPVLHNHKWLFPFMQVYRWFQRIFKKGVKFYTKELKLSGEISDERKDSIKALRKYLGL